MLAGFKKFIAQGNAVDLAVGVIIGAAFGAVVNDYLRRSGHSVVNFKALRTGGTLAALAIAAWWIGKAASPLCGPAASACAIVL